MKIGMDKLFVFNARFACPAGIGFAPVFAADIPGIGQSKGKCPASFGTGQHLGMTYTFLPDRFNKFCNNLLLTRNLSKVHLEN